MDFTIVVALVLIAAGVFRLFLVRTGKKPEDVGYQRYFPYAFIVMGALLFILGLMD